MRYLSVCAGIESASVAWQPLGWEALAFSEIDPFACAVLQHHYPDVPNWGDLTRFEEWPDATVDVLVGGTPCQSFSVAGLRAGLADPRGNLALTYLAVLAKYRPRWCVWENVPGVLSADSHDAPDPRPPAGDLDGDDGPADGTEVVVEDEYDADENHAFACLLAGFSELGYGFAYRVLDAQYFGLAQRRKRVFVVGHLGDWRRAAAVLFERASFEGHPAPRRETGQVAPTLSSRRTAGGGLGGDFDYDGGLIAFGGNNTSGLIDVATAVNAHGGPHGRLDFKSETFIVHSLRADGFDAGEDGTWRGTPLVAENYSKIITSAKRRNDSALVAFDARQSDVITYGDQAGPLDTDGHSIAVAYSLGSHAGAADATVSNRSHANGGPSGMGIQADVSHSLRAGRTQAVAFAENQRGDVYTSDTTQALSSGGVKPGQGYPAIASGMAVRRLTPLECTRLMGLPDGYLDIMYRGKPAADGNKYRALGNSFAVPVVRWIGSRIERVDALEEERARVTEAVCSEA